jgi:hypothetical protein
MIITGHEALRSSLRKEGNMPLEKYQTADKELGPEHFDGDPIESKITPARQKQLDEHFAELDKHLGLPKNNIQRQEEDKKK